MKRSTLFLLTSVLLLVLLFAGGGDQQDVGAQFGASFNPHGNYSAATSSCTACHQLHAEAVSAEAACTNCHPTVQTHKDQPCSACHEPHAQTGNAALVQPTIWSRAVRFDGRSFDDSGNGVCVACHTTTRYHGTSATNSHYENQDCTDCHPHSSGFRVDPQSCNSCHQDPPASGAHFRHEQADIGLTNCAACHQKVRNYRDAGHRNGRVNFGDGKDLTSTGVCSDCHGNASGIAEAKAAWKRGGAINDCTGCHNSADPAILAGRRAPAVDRYWASNGHGQGAEQDRDLDCQACHNPRAPHFGGNAGPRLWDTANTLCARCHADPARGGRDVSPHGNEGYDLSLLPDFSAGCDACHNPHGSANLAAVRETIRGSQVDFLARSGANSFDELDDSNADDLCATCHTLTSHNRVPSNRAQLSHFEGTDCADCHKHETDGDPATADAFMPQGGCLECHNQPMDNGDNIPPGGRPAVDGDFARRTHHLQGDPSDTKCVVCHDQSTHGDGYIDLRNADGGPTIRFVSAQDADIDLFCASCHDDNGAQVARTPGGSSADPFGEGANLLGLDKASAHSNTGFHGGIEEPFRTGCADCHAGHGSDNLELIRPTINGNSILFLARTGANSFDDPNKDDRNDLCATCHVGRAKLHAGGDHRPAGDLDLRGTDCTTCHLHDADRNIATADAFMPSCNACHGSPPPPAGNPTYALDESLTPHQKHAGTGEGEYGMDCSTCHDRLNPAYSGHVTDPPTFQDVFFSGRNAAASYDRSNRTCAGTGCHSNGDPRGGQLVVQTPRWDEGSTLSCAGCHADQFGLSTGSHAKHLFDIYRDRGADAIGCYECHADTAQNGHNDGIANTAVHTDGQKQVRIDVSDLWGTNDGSTFNTADLTCANSLCHSDGAASREQPGRPTFATPVWGNQASGLCGTCHAITPAQLSTGAHAPHFDSSMQGPGISNCETCHATYFSETHVNGQVDFADGQTLSQTAVCNDCHSPGGAVNGVVEARSNWSSSTAVGCEGCHDSQPAVIKGVPAPDMAGDGVTYGSAVTGHATKGIQCVGCHQQSPDSIHFDGVANSYDAEADNFQQTRWLNLAGLGGMNVPIKADEFYQRDNSALCNVCHDEAARVGLADGYSNALFTHSNPPPAGYPLNVPTVATLFRNENAAGFSFGNVPANIHWDHLDLNQINWDSDGDGAFDSKPNCGACHDVHGVKSVANGVAHPAMTYADMGIVYGVDGIGAYGEVTRTEYTARCSTCHPAAGIRYYRSTE